jgi:AAA15 family ATPase/GTPase
MLLEIAVTNFRSIRDRVELIMVKSGLKGLEANVFDGPNKKALLKSAVVFGPNASGKSGLLRAFKALEYMVLESASFKPDSNISPYEPYKLDKAWVNKPVIFELSYVAEEVQYEYFVSFTKKKIEKEELNFYPNGTRTLLFSRVDGKEMKFGDAYRGAKKTIEKLLLPNQLFLSKAAENNIEVLLEPYLFFKNGMLVFPMIEDYEENNMARLYAKRLAEDADSNFTKRFNALICALDTGISGVAVEEVDWKQYKFPGNMPDDIKQKVQEDYKYDIKTQHALFEDNIRVGLEKFDVDEESAGTKSLFVIGGIILDALESERVLVVDEFEKNLHPSITQFLIRLFHNPVTNPHNAQLVFATHDITQLAGDNFRRDQIWFTEKNEFGATSLFRCSDIQGIRLNTPLDKWYATGRFGATPIINDVDFLIAMQEEGRKPLEA